MFQRWKHLGTSLVLKIYFVSRKPVVHILDMWEVVLEWIKCGSLLDHKVHPWCHVQFCLCGGGCFECYYTLEK